MKTWHWGTFSSPHIPLSNQTKPFSNSPRHTSSVIMAIWSGLAPAISAAGLGTFKQPDIKVVLFCKPSRAPLIGFVVTDLALLHY